MKSIAAILFFIVLSFLVAFVQHKRPEYIENKNVTLQGTIRCIDIEEAPEEVVSSIFYDCLRYGMKPELRKNTIKLYICNENRTLVSVVFDYRCK